MVLDATQRQRYEPHKVRPFHDLMPPNLRTHREKERERETQNHKRSKCTTTHTHTHTHAGSFVKLTQNYNFIEHACERVEESMHELLPLLLMMADARCCMPFGHCNFLLFGSFGFGALYLDAKGRSKKSARTKSTVTVNCIHFNGYVLATCMHKMFPFQYIYPEWVPLKYGFRCYQKVFGTVFHSALEVFFPDRIWARDGRNGKLRERKKRNDREKSIAWICHVWSRLDARWNILPLALKPLAILFHLG